MDKGMKTDLQNIEHCLASLGTDRFPSVFSDFIEGFGIDQIMVFWVRKETATCLLSRHFQHAVLAEALSETYLGGWYRQDPLLPELFSLPAGRVEVRSLEDIQAQMSPKYREIFFDTPGLVAKTTLLAANEAMRLFVSLYQNEPGNPGFGEDLARIAGRLALMHYSQTQEAAFPAPLAVLSERERHVCIGILSGHKTEIIADEIGVAPSTVVTYRKRAYHKLGVTSRAGLFSICRR